MSSVGELLFFAYFVEALLIVTDDVTRAMLRERGIQCAQLYWLNTREQAATSRASLPAVVLISAAIGRILTHPALSAVGLASAPPHHDVVTPPHALIAPVAVVAATQALLRSAQHVRAPSIHDSRPLSQRTPSLDERLSSCLCNAAVLS